MAEKQVEDLRNTKGAAEYKNEQLKNIRESGSRFLEGFSIKNAEGRLFWVATLTELISNLITAKMQQKLLHDSIDAEASVNKLLGVFAES